MSLRFINQMLIALSLLACSTVHAVPLTVDVAGIESIGVIGDTDNTILTFNVGANTVVATIDYAVNLTAFPPSFLSEIGLAISASDGTGAIFFFPGFQNTNPGTGTYTGSIDLIALNLPVTVGNDGILRLEFFEDFNDLAGADGQWNFGTITFNMDDVVVPPGTDVPEPASVLLMGAGLALLACVKRRPVGARVRAS